MLSIKARRLSRHFQSGLFRSTAKGDGLEFSQVRPYVWGDDVRYLDWNVSARMVQPYIKVFEAEREQEVILLLDVSASMRIGILGKRNKSIQQELAATLATAAFYMQNRVGLLLFTEDNELFLPPGKSNQTLQRILQVLETYQPQGQKTNISNALAFLARRIRRSSLVFLISDFADWHDELALARLGRRHEVIGIRIWNPLEEEIPQSGLWRVRNPETGKEGWLDLGSSEVMGDYKRSREVHEGQLKAAFRRSGQRLLKLSTKGDWGKDLGRFLNF